MTIKKKIKVSNVLMVLVPILFTAIVITVCLNTSLGSYWHTLVSMYSDENGIQFAQSMLYNYQKELWEFNWVLCSRPDGTGETPSGDTFMPSGGRVEICQSEEMTELGNTLSELGYRFMITEDDKQIYSNLTEEDLRIGREVAGDGIDSAKMLTASRYEVSVIKNTFWHGEKVFCITAIHPEKTDGGAVDCFKSYIRRYIYGFIAFFVLLTVLVNGILSWWISKSILKPLNLLIFEAQEIREGNLDTRMQYGKKDEFGSVCRDFDDMRAYLKESVQQRLEDEKRRKNLITGISHDLRTPLTSISGYLDGLLDGIADTPEKQKRYLLAMKTRTGTMVNLVESLSEFSRLDRGFRYHMEYVELRDYARQYLETAKADMEQQKIKTELVCGKGTFPVLLDGKEFKRVFDNLFSNTAKYRGGDSSRVLISIKRTLSGESIELSFQDDGPGVPEESLGQIFDSFYRVDTSRNQAEKGSGIGLAVVREIILGHGGRVWAENRGGLAVIVRLPQKQEET